MDCGADIDSGKGAAKPSERCRVNYRKPTDYACLSVDDGYICNRLARHDGDHESVDIMPQGDALYIAHRWPNARPTGKPALEGAALTVGNSDLSRGQGDGLVNHRGSVGENPAYSDLLRAVQNLNYQLESAYLQGVEYSIRVEYDDGHYPQVSMTGKTE